MIGIFPNDVPENDCQSGCPNNGEVSRGHVDVDGGGLFPQTDCKRRPAEILVIGTSDGSCLVYSNLMRLFTGVIF